MTGTYVILALIDLANARKPILKVKQLTVYRIYLDMILQDGAEDVIYTYTKLCNCQILAGACGNHPSSTLYRELTIPYTILII